MDISDLGQHGVAKIKYYYERTAILPNVYTVCLFISEDKKILARGVSICSVMDQHRKVDGRKKSKDRAIKALMEKVTQLPVNSDRVKFFEVKKSFKMVDEKTISQAKKVAEEAFLNCLPHFEQKLNEVNHLHVMIPSWLPIVYTKQDFLYKSYFEPEPTEKEKSIIKGGKKE